MSAEHEESVKGLLPAWGLAARPCDSCKTSPALLFCRSHSAFLCAACEADIHNPTSRHQRVFLCEVCLQSPASVTCKADSAALCASCDQDIHSANPLASRHERLPALPFFDTPTALSAAKAHSVCSAFDDVLQTPPSYRPCSENTDAANDCNWPISNQNGKFVGLLNSDINSFLDFESLDDFAALKQQMMEQLPGNQSYAADSVVPVQTKRINLGKRTGESCFEIDFSQSKLSPVNHSAQHVRQSVSSSEVGVVPDGNPNSISEVSNFPFPKSTNSDGCSAMSSGTQPLQLIGIDREARVMRYREKRKNRKFEKTIRYASRKAYAERRPRIKGRFAKRVGAGSDAEQPFPAGLGGFAVEHGAVPLF